MTAWREFFFQIWKEKFVGLGEFSLLSAEVEWERFGILALLWSGRLRAIFAFTSFHEVAGWERVEHLSQISEWLVTIGEFGLTSRDSIYAKAQELQRTIHEMRSDGDNPEEQEKALKRINTLIKAYEEIVEGNYIDNLIKAQQEEKQAAEQNANAHKDTTKKALKR